MLPRFKSPSSTSFSKRNSRQKEWRRPRGCRHSRVAAYRSARPARSDFDGGNGASALRFLPPPLYRPAIRGERKHRVVPNAVPTFALPLRIGWRALGSRKTDPSRCRNGVFPPSATRNSERRLPRSRARVAISEIARSTAEGKSAPSDQYGICRGGRPKQRRQGPTP